MLEKIRLSLEKKFPISKITLHEDQSVLSIQVIGHDEHLSMTDINKVISKVLIDTGAFSKYSATTIKAYKSQEEFIYKIASETIKNANLSTTNSPIDTQIAVECKTIYVHLTSNQFHSIQNSEAVKKKIKEAFKENNSTPEYSPFITTKTYPPAFNWSLPNDTDDSDDSYDDFDDDTNPNWPSTTGNPSGGGRGNNI